MSIRAFAPSVYDGILLRAQQSTASGPPPTYSHSFAADPAKVDYVSALYRDDTLPTVRAMALANPNNVLQFLFVSEGFIYPMTNPSPQTSSANHPIAIGTMTDKVGVSTPASVRLHALHGWISVLMPLALVDKFQLPRAALLPDTIQGATTAAGVNEPGSFARLGFGPDAPTLAPTFACVPMMLGVPLGVHLPGEPWPLTDLNPELTAMFPLFEIWRAAHEYLQTNNGGTSVSMGGPMFDPAAFTVNIFPNSIPVRATSDTIYTMILPSSPHFTLVGDMVTVISRDAMLRVAEALGPVPPVTPPGTVVIDVETGLPDDAGTARDSQCNLWTPARMLRVMEAMNNNKGPVTTQVENELKAAAAIVCAKMSIAFARLIPSDDGSPPNVVPANIRPQFVEILSTTKLSTATRLLREAVDVAVRRAASSDNRFDGHVNMTGDFVDGVVVACLRDFRFLTHSMDSEPQRVKTWLSLLALVSPGANEGLFQNRVDRGNTLAFQEAVGEAPAKMDRKSTELFVGGSLGNGDHAIATFANWRLLCNIITDDYDASEMRKNMWTFETNLHSDSGRLWLRRIASMPQVTLNLLVAANDITAAYFMIATLPEYRDAVMSGAPVHSDPYLQAKLLSAGVANDLYTAVVRNTVLLYSHIPHVASVLPHLRLTAALPVVPPAFGGANNQHHAHSAGPSAGGNFPFQPVRNQHHGNGGGGGYGGGGYGGGGHGNGGGRGGAHFSRDNNNRPSRDNNNRVGGVTFARNAPQDEPRGANGKQHGFLTFTGATGGGRTLPNCDVFVKLTGMKSRERVCMYFATKNFFCPHGTDCKQAHISAYNRLPNGVQTLIKTFVERTPGLTFTADQAPPGAQV